MRQLTEFIVLAALTLAVPQTVLSQPSAQAQASTPAREQGESRGPFLLAATATVVPAAIGLHQAMRESPFSGDEAGVWVAGGALVFGPTLGYVALGDWNGAVQGTSIRLALAGVTAWIASESDDGWGDGELAAIPAALGAAVAVLDLYDLYRRGSPVRQDGLSIAPDYDPRTRRFGLLARGHF